MYENIWLKSPFIQNVLKILLKIIYFDVLFIPLFHLDTVFCLLDSYSEKCQHLGRKRFKEFTPLIINLLRQAEKIVKEREDSAGWKKQRLEKGRNREKDKSEKEAVVEKLKEKCTGRVNEKGREEIRRWEKREKERERERDK